MPEIEIRPCSTADLPLLLTLDASYTTEHVWQMEFRHARERGWVEVAFRRVRLPRSLTVAYPRSQAVLLNGGTSGAHLLVATFGGQVVGYIRLLPESSPGVVWVSDLVVAPYLRRQGVGSGLVLAAAEWAAAGGARALVMEMQPKNDPAIQFALKLGFEFCGYSDVHYANHEIGLFWRRAL